MFVDELLVECRHNYLLKHITILINFGRMTGLTTVFILKRYISALRTSL